MDGQRTGSVPNQIYRLTEVIERKLTSHRRVRRGRLFLMMSRRFGSCEIEVTLQRIQDKAGKLICPFVLLGFGPVTIQANGFGEIFGERLPVSAIADKNVAQLAAAGGVVNTTAGASSVIGKAQKHFSAVSIFPAIVPGMTGIDFGMRPAPVISLRLGRGLFFRRIVIENSLAGIAIN